MKVAAFTLVLAAATVLCSASTLQRAKRDYLPDGPQVDVPIATLTSGGWTLCHKELYINVLNDTMVGPIQGKCHKNRIFLGCKRVGTDLLTVAAWGNRATVFTDVIDEDIVCMSDCKFKVEAGTKWYRTPMTWGFASGEYDLFLATADLGDKPGPGYPQDGTARKRMSWNINLPVGGFRCGASTRLLDEKSNDWERVLFHAD